jgi:hypothetical protein
MTTVNEALRYPMEGDGWKKTILIGGILTIFGFLIVPLLAVYGYVIRVIRHRLDGESQPPEFGEWGELLIDGVKVLVIGIVYSIIPGLLFAVTVGGSIAAIATGSRGGAAAGAAGLTIGFLIALVLSLVFGYVAVAALVNFAAEGRIGAAFDLGTLRTVITTREYAIAWLLAVAIFVGAAVVTGLLNVIPILGAIIGAFVIFYAEVAAATLWAGGFTDAMAAE